MRRAVLLVLAALAAAVPAAPQTGVVCLFADSTGTVCNPADHAAGLLKVYVVHKMTPGALGLQFSAPRPSCMVGATWAGDEPVFPVTLGNSQGGVSVAYGTCLSGEVHALTIDYVVSGATLADCAYSVMPVPGTTYVEVVDCGNDIRFAPGGTTYINSSLDCLCDGLTVPPVLDVSPPSLSFVSVDELPITIRNLGGETLTWSLTADQPWLTLNPASGSGDAIVTASVDRTGIPPGVYHATIDVSSNGGSETVSVTMTVLAADPVLVVSPTSLDLGAPVSVGVFYINNGGGPGLYWTLATDQPWLSVLPTAGFGNRDIMVRVDRSGLLPGIYSGTVFVASNGGGAQVSVAMTVAEPALLLSPTALDFGTTATELSFTISNLGSGTLVWDTSDNQPWISVAPDSGMVNASAIVTVTVDRSGLPEGVHTGEVLVTSNGGDGVVNIRVEQGPAMALAPTSLEFGATDTQKTFAISNVGIGTLSWNAAPDSAWITVNPSAGTGDAVVMVTVDRAGLPPGEHFGSVAVTSNGGDGVVSVHVAGIIAAGGGGEIGVYADQAGGDCQLVDPGSGVCSYYVVQKFAAGATGSQFRVTSHHLGVPLPDTHVFPVTIGTAHTGVTIGYGACLESPIHVLTLNYACEGHTPACAVVEVVGHPTAAPPGLLSMDCANGIRTASGFTSYVNGDGGCNCALVKTEETTWGRVKAMYRGDPTAE